MKAGKFSYNEIYLYIKGDNLYIVLRRIKVNFYSELCPDLGVGPLITFIANIFVIVYVLKISTSGLEKWFSG